MKTLIKSLIAMRDEFNVVVDFSTNSSVAQKFEDYAATIKRAERALVLLDNAEEVVCGGIVMKEIYVEEIQKALR